MDIAASPPGANGSVTEHPLERIKRELRDELAPITSRREQLQAALADLSEEESRIASALAALNGEVVRKKPAPAAKPTPTPAYKGHKVGQATLDEVYEYFAEHGEMTATEVIDGLGVSESAVRAAIAKLREDERLRITGTKRGIDDTRRSGGKPPNTYGVMP